jgi:hypothetical protein
MQSHFFANQLLVVVLVVLHAIPVTLILAVQILAEQILAEQNREVTINTKRKCKSC